MCNVNMASYVIVLLLSISLTAGEIRNAGWWKYTVIYQIYPRSFLDFDNDGIGDLKGITSKLEYFVESGVGAIWLSPIYASPMLDFGYDIMDFKAISAIFGTMADFEELVARAKGFGLKIILDLVPNHTSNQHEWFQRAISGDPRYKEYYVWKDGKNNNTEPPNNWLSAFGGSAWTYHNATEQWYLHQFLKEQPDLNYAHPFVQQEMKDIIRFWLDKGVDGFRIDAIMFLFEHDSFADEPRSNIPNVNETDYEYLEHIYTANDPRTYKEVASWKQLLSDYANQSNADEKVMLTEVYSTLDNVMKYYDFGSDVPFNFLFIDNVTATSSPEHYKYIIDSWLKTMPVNKTANWVMGNHDRDRVASRYPRRVDQMTMLAMILPGVAITYYGEEIGMVNAKVSWEDTQDTAGCNAGKENYEKLSRDPARTPFQWNNSTNAGFNRGAKPWLPIHDNYIDLNLLDQKITYASHYKIYQSLTTLRKTSAALRQNSYRCIVLQEKVLAIIRQDQEDVVVLLINFSDSVSITVDLTKEIDKKHRKTIVEIADRESNVKWGTLVDLKRVTVPMGASLVLTSTETSSAFTMSPVHFVLALMTIVALVPTRGLLVGDL